MPLRLSLPLCLRLRLLKPSSSSHLRPPLRFPHSLLFSTASAASAPPYLSLFDPLARRLDGSPRSLEIAAAIEEWFRSDPHSYSLFDRIYIALASSHDDGSLNAALSALRFRVSEPLVISVLDHRPHPSVTSAIGRDLLFLRIRFFDWSGRQNPYRHTRSSYHAVFRLLRRAKKTARVINWLRDFSSSSPELRGQRFLPGGDGTAAGPYARFHDTLVVGYSVAGKPELALQLLARMRFQGLDLQPFSYHVLLNSLVEASNFDFAGELFRHITDRGLAGPVTNCIHLKSLCRQGRLWDAEVYLRECTASTTAGSRAVSGSMVKTLVQTLCQKRKFETAERIINEFGSTEAYGVWIANLLGAGNLDAVLEFLVSKKTSEDYIPERFHYSKLVVQLLKKHRLKDVYNILVEMMDEGIAPDCVTINATLCFFCKAGMVDVALFLYNSRRELGINPNTHVYDQLINALCGEGNVDEVCLILDESIQQGYFPGNQTFIILSNFLLREGKLDKMQKLLDDALERKVKPLPVVFTKYMSALLKSDKVGEAWRVMNEMVAAENTSLLMQYKYTHVNLIERCILLREVNELPRRIIVMQECGHVPSRSLYRSVVCCLCEMGEFEAVLDLLNKQLERHELDKRTCYHCFIDGAAHSKKPHVAREVYNRMQNAGTEPTLETNILILKSYLKSKQIGDALSFFCYLCEKQDPKTKLYNIFITGLCEAGKPEQAVMFWKEARQKRLIPSLQCYEELVLELSSTKDYDTVVKVLDDFMETGRPVSAFLCNVLLQHTLKSQELLQSWVNSRESNNVGARSGETQISGAGMFGHLIAAFSGGIRIKESLDELDELLERFFPIDVFTYNMLFRGMTKAGWMDYACHLFHKMSNKGFEPNQWTYDIIVHGFCKQGNRKEAERWIKEMNRKGFHPTWYTWRVFNHTS